MNELIESLQITDLTHDARGVGRLPDGRVVFAAGALPGERARVRVAAGRKGVAEGELLGLENRSQERVEPPCPVFGRCGGCAAQHMRYEATLQWKQNRVVQALRRVGGVPEGAYDLTPIQGTGPWRTRNKAEYKLCGGAVGFFAARSHEVVDAPDCLLQHPEIVRMAERLRAEGPYEGTQTAVLRVSRTGEGWADGGRLGFGAEPPEEELDGFRYRLAPDGFWQVNAEGLERLLERLLDFAALQGDERVLDAYCGAGAFSLPLAKRARSVFGVDLHAPTIEAARGNARRAGLAGCAFEPAAVEDAARAFGENAFDLAVLDPPRAGCHPDALRGIADSGARRVIYISCDPATLARDVKVLAGMGYGLRAAAPVDMFPWTAHVETAALLCREESTE